jgi:membrane protease subunit (stomatin/prohibitin family)
MLGTAAAADNTGSGVQLSCSCSQQLVQIRHITAAVRAVPRQVVVCNAPTCVRVLLLQALQVMRQQGKRLLFVTNNSSKSRAQYVKKFESLGMQVDSSEVSSGITGCRLYSRCWSWSQQPCPC